MNDSPIEEEPRQLTLPFVMVLERCATTTYFAYVMVLERWSFKGYFSSWCWVFV